MDVRITRSQRNLWRGFFELMTDEKLPFSAITINQICEKALVHRSTFYQHFSDKYALLDYGLQTLYTPYWELSSEAKLQAPFVTAASFFKGSQAEELLETQKQDAVFQQLLQEKSSQSMAADFYDYYQKLELDELPTSLLVQQTVSTIFALSQWQQGQTDNISPETMDKYFQRLKPTIQ